MKKFVVLLVVVAMTCISSMAFAASEVAVSGSLDIRGRNLNNLDLTDTAVDTTGGADTQERVRVNIDAKTGDTKAKITIENDWDTWGRFEADQGAGKLAVREAWVNFNLPGVPVNVNAGHQLLSLGNGWFFRSMKYGSDAWVLANVTGNNTAAFVNVKFAENTKTMSDDMDAYVLIDMIKLSDTAMAGINITDLKDRSGATKTDLQNIGLHYTGKVGPVALKAELDVQMGKNTTDATPAVGDNKFKGNQIVIEGKVPMGAVGVNFTIARGTGQDTTSTTAFADGYDITAYQNALDVDPHYTFMYEYLIPTAAGATHTGFSNTTALNLGASMAASKNVTVSADIWMLQATEELKDNSAGAAAADTTTDLGTEIDVKANWAMAENLSLNGTLGYFMPGAAYAGGTAANETGTDAAMGLQLVLGYKF